MDEEKEFRNRAERRGLPIIREESHKMLVDIVSRLQPRNILEIGTAVGYSGMLMLEASKEAHLLTIEHDDYKVKEARANFESAGFGDRATVVLEDCDYYVSMLALDDENAGKFDFIFLDGPKAQYIKMLESLLILTKHGGTILVDNVLFRGFVRGDKSEMPRRYKTIVKRLEMFLDAVEHHPAIEKYTLHNIEDGMLEIIVK